MKRSITVYNCDRELLQWVDQKRFLRLAEGQQCYRLRALGNNRNDDRYFPAPDEVQPIFLRVVLDCSAVA